MNTCSDAVDDFLLITPDFWYSATLFSKKFVFPSKEMFSMKSNGFWTLKTCQNKKNNICNSSNFP